ncbi:hypothetical protein Slin15195_G029860 [Septoria linicola]|uniref:Secreted protein n=1 Tax=Septoria linicola TaxID=215465 RepID=A0A9Q9EH92_9PEZI|nr:hypothetical protein Slin15195_G029860 [Septoria linicola]
MSPTFCQIILLFILPFASAWRLTFYSGIGCRGQRIAIRTPTQECTEPSEGMSATTTSVLVQKEPGDLDSEIMAFYQLSVCAPTPFATSEGGCVRVSSASSFRGYRVATKL